MNKYHIVVICVCEEDFVNYYYYYIRVCWGIVQITNFEAGGERKRSETVMASALKVQ